MIRKVEKNLSEVGAFPKISTYTKETLSSYGNDVEAWLNREATFSTEFVEFKQAFNLTIDDMNVAIQTLEDFTTTNTASEAKAKGYMKTTKGYMDTTEGYMDDTQTIKSDTQNIKEQAQFILDAFNNVQLNSTQVATLFEQFGQKISWQRKIIEDDTTAVHNDFLLINTITKEINITLPTPQDDLRVKFLDLKSNFENNKITILRNGGRIMGLDENMEVETNNISFEMICQDGDWRIV